MNMKRNFTLSLLLSTLAAAITLAQEPQDVRPAATASTVTLSISDKGVRFAVLGTIKQIRLEVFNEAGDSLYNSSFQAGNVRDWNIKDKRGLPLPDGTYLCVVTYREVSGAVGLKQGRLLVQAGRPSFQLEVGEKAGAAE